MSSDFNNLSNETSEQLEDNPPAYYTSSSVESTWNFSAVTSSEQAWSDSPPAYDSLPDIPIRNVSQLIAPPHDQPWDFPLPLPGYSPASSHPNQNPANAPITSECLFVSKFQRGKPLVVAVLLILCSFVQITVGTLLAFNDRRKSSQTLTYGIPYWTSVWFISTGCTMIAAKAKTTRSRVKASLVFNILSLGFSSLGLIFNAKDIITLCKGDTCYNRTQLSAFDISYILLSANVVVMALCLSTSVIGTYVLFCLPRETPQTFLVENDFSTELPELPQTHLHFPPPPYTAEDSYKEDDEDETPR